jgi:inosine-uridine nucleoside N-ribohydrolase
MNLRHALLFLLLPAIALATDARRKVIIDQDAFGPGGSNLQAILMVLGAPDVEVLGITIESGDGWQKENVAHTLRMLELIGRTDIPVVPGAVYPLVNSEEETRRWETLYGQLPYKGAWMESWPDYSTMKRPPHHAADVVPPLAEGEPQTKPAAESAAAFLLRMTAKYPGEVSILALGPFTNLALAQRIDPEFAARAKELVFMGGSLSPQQPVQDEFSMEFIHNPRVEFNIRWDPEAAKIMLHAPWKSMVQVPLDATTDTKFTEALLKEVSRAPTPVGRYLAKYGIPGFPMWDEVAAAVWLDPSIIRHSDRISIDVDIGHGADYGAMVSWPAGRGPGLGEPVVTVVRRIDVMRLERGFVKMVESARGE